MTRTKPKRNQIAAGVVILIALAIVGGLVWGFGQQLALARQMRAEEMWLEQAVAAEKARHDELAAQLEYVRSDEYVEQWAREETRMARPGEVVVVPLEDEGDESAMDAQSEQAPVPEPRPFWIELWELVFGPAERP